MHFCGSGAFMWPASWLCMWHNRLRAIFWSQFSHLDLTHNYQKIVLPLPLSTLKIQPSGIKFRWPLSWSKFIDIAALFVQTTTKKVESNILKFLDNLKTMKLCRQLLCVYSSFSGERCRKVLLGFFCCWHFSNGFWITACLSWKEYTKRQKYIKKDFRFYFISVWLY